MISSVVRLTRAKLPSYIDFSTAFDIDHNILFQRLHSFIGLLGTTFEWFCSYLSDYNQYLNSRNTHSKHTFIHHSITQGSVLRHFSFYIHLMPIKLLFWFSSHFYADNTQIYIICSPCSFIDTVSVLIIITLSMRLENFMYGLRDVG